MGRLSRRSRSASQWLPCGAAMWRPGAGSLAALDDVSGYVVVFVALCYTLCYSALLFDTCRLYFAVHRDGLRYFATVFVVLSWVLRSLLFLALFSVFLP